MGKNIIGVFITSYFNIPRQKQESTLITKLCWSHYFMLKKQFTHGGSLMSISCVIKKFVLLQSTKINFPRLLDQQIIYISDHIFTRSFSRYIMLWIYYFNVLSKIMKIYLKHLVDQIWAFFILLKDYYRQSWKLKGGFKERED